MTTQTLQPRRMGRPPINTERDAQIVSEMAAGANPGKLARRYGIGVTSVLRIYRRAVLAQRAAELAADGKGE